MVHLQTLRSLSQRRSRRMVSRGLAAALGVHLVRSYTRVGVYVDVSPQCCKSSRNGSYRGSRGELLRTEGLCGTAGIHVVANGKLGLDAYLMLLGDGPFDRNRLDP